MAKKDLNKIQVYGTMWSSGEEKTTAVAQQIWDTEREIYVSQYPDLFGNGDINFPDIPEIDNTLTISGQAADSKTVGDRLNEIVQQINNFPIPKEEKYRGNITLARLLLLEAPEDGLMYHVYLTGNEEEGYSTENFIFNGNSYAAGSTMIYEVDHWRVKDPEEKQDYKASSFDALQNKLVLPLNIKNGFAHTYQASVDGTNAGIHLFDAYIYNLTPDGYEREYTEFNTPSGKRRTDLWTVRIPYAKRKLVSQGGSEFYEYYEGGVSSELLSYIYTHRHLWSDIDEKPDFADVAISGSYNDLVDAPNLDVSASYSSGTLIASIGATKIYIPNQSTVNNGKLSINVNGTEVASFTANSASNVPVNLNIPTDTVRFVKQDYSTTAKAIARNNIGAGTSNFDGKFSSLTGVPAIPSTIGDLIDDSWWFGHKGSSTSLYNGFMIIGSFSHTPEANNEWSFNLHLDGLHASNHGYAVLRIYSTDVTDTAIGTPNIHFISRYAGVNDVDLPRVRIYKDSNTKYSIGVYCANKWAGLRCKVTNLYGTDIERAEGTSYKENNESFVVEAVRNAHILSAGNQTITGKTTLTSETTDPLVIKSGSADEAHISFANKDNSNLGSLGISNSGTVVYTSAAGNNLNMATQSWVTAQDYIANSDVKSYQSTGTKIATIGKTDIYAPSGSNTAKYMNTNADNADNDAPHNILNNLSYRSTIFDDYDMIVWQQQSELSSKKAWFKGYFTAFWDYIYSKLQGSVIDTAMPKNPLSTHIPSTSLFASLVPIYRYVVYNSSFGTGGVNKLTGSHAQRLRGTNTKQNDGKYTIKVWFRLLNTDDTVIADGGRNQFNASISTVHLLVGEDWDEVLLPGTASGASYKYSFTEYDGDNAILLEISDINCSQGQAFKVEIDFFSTKDTL